MVACILTGIGYIPSYNFGAKDGKGSDGHRGSLDRELA
jgi:hypothetical protein